MSLCSRFYKTQVTPKSEQPQPLRLIRPASLIDQCQSASHVDLRRGAYRGADDRVDLRIELGVCHVDSVSAPFENGNDLCIVRQARAHFGRPPV
jgi:hypothetical protein